MYSYWRQKCKWCGKGTDMAGMGNVSKEGEFPPVREPDVSLLVADPTCHESPNGRHKFEWVRYK